MSNPVRPNDDDDDDLLRYSVVESAKDVTVHSHMKAGINCCSASLCRLNSALT